MLNIARLPDDFRIITSDKEVIDAKVRFVLKDKQLDVYLSATEDCLRMTPSIKLMPTV